MWLLIENPQRQKDHTEFYKMVERDVYQANIEQDTAIQNLQNFLKIRFIY